MTDLPGIARTAQTTAAQALATYGLGSLTAAAQLRHAALLASAAFDAGAPVADVHPPLHHPPSTAAAAIPAPRPPAFDPKEITHGPAYVDGLQPAR